jgi:tetratricopeptide (TPR) repeat protein/serine/threonine protein kinase
VDASPRKAREVLLAAIKLPAKDRQAYLQEACGGDQDLFQRVSALLQAQVEIGSFHEAPVPTIDQPMTEAAGTSIGPYKLLEQIGEGGMGTVWMAQQTEPVKRLVAVKLIKAGMDSKQVIARFEAERQALALMDHPNIARVLDGGTTSSGRPYFVMDLVKGVPITRYCDEHRLTPCQRLELFIPVCQAVQHAHQKGVIHRDLKPSNVLVALYDGKPVPKVIDFGVAKAAGQSLTDKTLVTGFGALVGTLEYMSPEQAEINQLDIDTRSDIYSLGVLLYELLTGSTPFTKKELEKAGMLEMLRVIREEEPSKPSTKLSTAEGLPTLAANRGTEPAKLTRLVRGELDWIVMKALEKDRGRRYETANGFALDVQRYLADEPVLACPPSAGYRLRKFARRNKARLTVAGVLGMALLVAVAVIGWAVRDRAAREQAAAKERLDQQDRLTTQVELILEDVDRLEREQKWPEALAAAGRAEAVLAGGEAGDSIQQRVRDVRRDLDFVARLDRIRQTVANNVEGKFNDREGAREYALAFRDYGVDVNALPPAEAVARLRGKPALAMAIAAALDDWVLVRVILGEEKTAWQPLVTVARGIDPDPLRDRLRAAWGGPLTPEARAELRRLAESIDVKALAPATLLVLAGDLHYAHLTNAALRTLRDGQYAHPADFFLNLELSNRLFEKNDYDGALRYVSVAVSLRPDSSPAHFNLGNTLLEQGKIDEAVAEYRTAVALDPKFARAHTSLGRALLDQGKLDEAVAECRTAIALDPKDGAAHCNLGNALAEKKELEQALDEYRKAVALDPKNSAAHNNLGSALLGQGKLDEAVAEFREAMAVDPTNASAQRNLGDALHKQGKLDEAAAEYRKAIALDPKNSAAHNNLGITLRDERKLDEAVAEFREAIALDPTSAFPHANLGDTLLQQGKLDEAVAGYRKAIALNPKLAGAHARLGAALGMLGKFDEAVAECHKAVVQDPKDGESHHNLGAALSLQGKAAEAIPAFKEAIRLKPDHVAAYNALAGLLTSAADPKLRDGGEAVKLARKAVQLAPTDSGSWQVLGWALCSTGAWKDSADAFRKSIALQQDPKGGDSGQWFGLAIAHWKLGAKDEARKWYEQAVKWMDKNAKDNDELRRFRREAEEVLEIKKK